jgi:hypothetical protein
MRVCAVALLALADVQRLRADRAGAGQCAVGGIRGVLGGHRAEHGLLQRAFSQRHRQSLRVDPGLCRISRTKHGYRGFVTCKTKLASLPQAQGYLAMLIENSRGARLSDGSPQNYVETGWRYARSASAMDFLYR